MIHARHGEAGRRGKRFAGRAVDGQAVVETLQGQVGLGEESLRGGEIDLRLMDTTLPDEQ